MIVKNKLLPSRVFKIKPSSGGFEDSWQRHSCCSCGFPARLGAPEVAVLSVTAPFFLSILQRKWRNTTRTQKSKESAQGWVNPHSFNNCHMVAFPFFYSVKMRKTDLPTCENDAKLSSYLKITMAAHLGHALSWVIKVSLLSSYTNGHFKVARGNNLHFWLKSSH